MNHPLKTYKVKKINQIFLFIVIVLLSTQVSFAQNFLPSMVKVKGGTFTMGCDSNNYALKTHPCKITTFYISKYEITIAEFEQFVVATGYIPYSDKNGAYHFNHTVKKRIYKPHVNWKTDTAGVLISQKNYNLPVRNITWFDAMSYCAWFSEKTGKYYRLPTEAEWEYASKGGKKTQNFLYSGSNDFKEVGWTKIDLIRPNLPKAVGRKKPNELGLYNMTGNVNEICLDFYTRKYNDYQKENPVNNEVGSDTIFVVKGGSYLSREHRCRVYYRTMTGNNALHHYYTLGFRVVQSEIRFPKFDSVLEKLLEE